MLLVSKSLYVGGNSFLSFSSSVLVSDLSARFGLSFNQISSVLNSVFYKIFVDFSFKLPFNNILSKFKNRVHFLLYYLFFEILTSQKPKILVKRERLKNISSFKNKRELKKAKESIGIQSFSFNVSLSGSEQISKFLLILSFFVAPYTNRKLNPPSKYVPFSIVESNYDSTNLNCLRGTIKNLSIFPNFNLIDDLSALNINLIINLFPLKTNSRDLIFHFFGAAYGLSISDFYNDLNLRFLKF